MTTRYRTLKASADTVWNKPAVIDYPRLSRRGRRLRSAAIFSAARALQHFVLERVIDPLQRWREERAKYNELMALDDVTLKDIGVSRSDIRAIASGNWETAALRQDGVGAARVELVVDNEPGRRSQACLSQGMNRSAA